MDIINIAGIGIIASIMCLFFAKDNKEFSILISITAGVIIFFSLLSYLYPIIEVVNTYSLRANMNTLHIKAIFKIIATAYIAQFASDICRDSNNSLLSSKIELSARIMIIYFSLPIVVSLFEYIGDML